MAHYLVLVIPPRRPLGVASPLVEGGLAAKRLPAVPSEAPFKRELGDPKDRSEGLTKAKIFSFWLNDIRQ